MVVRTSYANPISDGDQLNQGYFNGIPVVPIGSVIAWHKFAGQKQSGTNTSVSSGKLIDTAATFSTNNVNANHHIYAYLEDTTAHTPSSTSYTLATTLTIDASGNNGAKINYVLAGHTGVVIGGGTNRTHYMYATFYYTDATTDDSATYSSASIATFYRHLVNPNPTKVVSKVEIYHKYSGTSSYRAQLKSVKMYLNEDINITAVDSETQLSIDNDVFLNTDINYVVGINNTLPENWIEMNGQTVTGTNTDFDGVTVPDLNITTQRFLRGSQVSGETGGSEYHYHTLQDYSSWDQSGGYSGSTLTYNSYHIPPYMEVVWIMRIK